MANPSQEFLDCVATLKLAGNISRDHYVEAMFVMDYNYPGRGWSEQATKLEAFYRKLEAREENEKDDLTRLIEQILPDLKGKP